jgi:hypothetical protein
MSLHENRAFYAILGPIGGFGPARAPFSGLPYTAIHSLPLPIHPVEVCKGFDQIRLDGTENLLLGPADERPMHRAIVREGAREMIPMEAGPHPEDDRV